MSLFSKLTNTVDIPSQFPKMAHPMPPLDANGDQPVQTNKFYTNMLLDDRNLYAYTLPYSIWWTGASSTNFVGMAVSHEDADSRIFGPDASASTVEYFFSPTGRMSMCLSAHWEGTPEFSTNAWGPLSLNAFLKFGSARIVFPICSGMGFVTGIYSGIAPMISSPIGFKSMVTAPSRTGVTRINVTLENNKLWSIYVTSPTKSTVTVTQRDSQHITVNSTESNLVVQVAKLGDSSWQRVIDSAAGAFPTQVSLDGGVTSDFSVATYSIDYNLAGSSTGGGTLLYAAPHHVSSFSSTMNGKVTNFTLESPSNGSMRLCVSQNLEMFERLPMNVGFLPWSVKKPVGDANFKQSNFSSEDIELIVSTAMKEIDLDVVSETNLGSLYNSGKVMSKFANILLVLTYIAKQTQLAKQFLASMKSALDTFIQNKQQTPLFYDLSWKGLVSQAGRNDAIADFGNTYYNDHHFHYGYFIHSAAIIGKVDQDIGDGSWAKNSTNRDWVNSLIRNVAAFGNDTTYPQSRMFDWYCGYGHAKGLFSSADGKDEESSSEDYNCWYGMKLWGMVINDKMLSARASLILAIERRAMNMYMLYTSGNTTMPKQIIGNKVSGIKFENKIDHTTYFGTLLQYIQGAHMIPTTPISSFIRSPQFVQEQWSEMLQAIIDSVDDGWKGILYLDYALANAQAAYDFFSSPSFKTQWLDNGQSRTWGLAFTKGLI